MTAEVLLRWSVAEVPAVAPGVGALVKMGERIEVGKIVVRSGTTLARHSHPEEQMFYLLAGSLQYSIGDAEIVAVPGDLIYFPSNVPHGGSVCGGEDAVFLELKSRPDKQG